MNPEEVNSYIKNPHYISGLTEMDRKKKLTIVGSVLVARQTTFDECIQWARMQFEEWYGAARVFLRVLSFMIVC